MSDDTPAPSRGRRKGQKQAKDKGSVSFLKDLPQMMFGFGDVQDPDPKTVELVQDLVFEFMEEMTYKAQEVSAKPGKLQTEDLIFAIRKDNKKNARAVELLAMNEELKQARKQFGST